MWGASLGVAGLLYLKVWLPATGIGVPCLFHELTGLYCPGCGITHAAQSLAGLDFVRAFEYNPLVFGLFPLFVAYLITSKKQMRFASKGIMAVMLTLTVAFGILRNIPYFDGLA